eukprot:1767008-Pyramimonas_sp.AAC.1
MGGCELRNCRRIRGLLRGAAEAVVTRGFASPWEVANCATVATLVTSWEVQRRRWSRRSRRFYTELVASRGEGAVYVS